MQKFLQKYFFVGLLLLIVVASIVRLWRIWDIPAGMSDDETRLTYTAYSIWHTGRDLNGRFLPLNFAISGYSFNPVPIYLTSPFVAILGLSMWSARLPFALAGVGTIVILYFLTKKLTGSRVLSLLSSFVLAFSVWHIQLSRFAYEGDIALFFYTLGTYLFVRVKKKSTWLLLASLVAFVLGFYSYSGYKITLVPLLALLVWYKRTEIVKKQIIMIVLAIIVAFGSFWYLGKTQGALQYGASAFFFSDKATIENAVELERRASTAPEILKKLYHNKATYVFRIFFQHYEYAFSPQYLFSDQEGSGIFSVWFRGQMYYHEAILLLGGALWLFLKKRKVFVLAIGLLAVSALPSGLGPEPITYTIRSSYMLLWLSLFVGCGIYGVSTFVTNKNWRFLCWGVFAIVYVYSIGGYLSQYYFDWSRYGAKYYSKADHDLATFLIQAKRSQRIILVSDVQPMAFLHYAFDAGIDPSRAQNVYSQQKITIDNITFSANCPDLVKVVPQTMVPSGSMVVLTSRCIEGQKLKLAPKPDTILKSLENENQWYVFKT